MTDNEYEVLKEQVFEQLFAEQSGFWASCSGCSQLDEGHHLGTYSDIFNYHLDTGRRECGGVETV